MFVVMNTKQFTILEDKDQKGGSDKDKQIAQSLNNDQNHEMSAIVINQSQLDYLRNRIEMLKVEAFKKDSTSKIIEEAKNRSI